MAEYKDPIDLMYHPSSMEIGLCLNKSVQKWTKIIINDTRMSHYTYDRGSLLFRSAFVNLC